MDRHHGADKGKAHPECGKDRINFQLSLVFRTAHQRTQQNLVDHPVTKESQRCNDQHCHDRADRISDEDPEGRQGTNHQKLAIRKVHDSGDAILQVQTKRDQRIGPAQQQPCDDYVHLASPHDDKPVSSGAHLNAFTRKAWEK